MGKLDDPQGAADKWATAMGSAGPAYIAGINGVQTAPGQAAARASGKYLQRVQANVAKFEKNVSSVDIGTWKTLAIDKGATRLGSGATAAKSKMAAFTTSFFAYLKAGQATINAMPTDTIEQSKAKAMAQIDYNARYPGYR